VNSRHASTRRRLDRLEASLKPRNDPRPDPAVDLDAFMAWGLRRYSLARILRRIWAEDLVLDPAASARPESPSPSDSTE
jgi:hypothetical protein